MTTSARLYSVAIIGAGDIGSRFDSPQSKHILTHAHSFSKNSRTKLVAIVDIDSVRGKKEARRWKTRFFSNVDEMLKSILPDIVVIATPDDTHAALLEKVVLYGPKLIVCEKPVVYKMSEVEHVRSVFNKYQIPVVVNFRRRFDDSVRELRDDIVSGKYGNVLSASGVYVRGILHNGSHLLDLARYLFGEVKNVIPIFSVADRTHGDNTIGGVATFERCRQLYLVPGDGRHFSVFELDILTEKGRIRFIDEGLVIEVQKVIPDPHFIGYYMLGKPEYKKTGLMNSMSRMAMHVVAILDGKEKNLSSLEDTLETQSVCFRFLKDFKK